MATRTAVWNWILALVVMAIGTAIAIPLYRFSDRDDAPGGMVIALMIFFVGVALAIRIVNKRPVSPARR